MATHQTTKGHDVEKVIGDADAIETRGTQVVNLGNSMDTAETILSELVSNGSDMEGKAIDKLSESASEVTAELRLAADLYMAVGPFIRDYGTSLGDVQQAMTGIVENANALWETYQQKLSAVDSAENSPVAYPSGTSPSDDGSAREEAETEHADAVADARGEAQVAYREWKEEADKFDVQYDTWWTAFTTAADGIENATGDGIQDSFWDNLDGLVEFLQNVLAIAGIVVFVLGLILSGPFALIGLVIGIVALALTVYQYARGDAGVLDLVLGVVGVLPIGALGDVVGGFGTRFAQGFDDIARMAPDLPPGLPNPLSNAAFGNGMVEALSPMWRGGGDTFLQAMRSGDMDIIATRLVTGRSPDFFEAMSDAPTFIQAINGFDVAAHFMVKPFLTFNSFFGVATDSGPGLVEQIRWPTW